MMTELGNVLQLIASIPGMVDDANGQLAELVEACKTRQTVGKLQLTLTVDPEEDKAFVTGQVQTSAPKGGKRKQVMFFGDDCLLSADPNQPVLPGVISVTVGDTEKSMAESA